MCDNCVLKFDHHCPWIGNCVGLRNYRFFLFYVFWQIGVAMFLFGISLWHIIKLAEDMASLANALSHTPGTVVVIVFSGLSVPSVLFLGCYHLRLVTHNVTTNEDIKSGPSAYSRGCLHNWLDTLFGVRVPSQLLSRELLRDGVHPSNRRLLNAVVTVQ